MLVLKDGPTFFDVPSLLNLGTTVTALTYRLQRKWWSQKTQLPWALLENLPSTREDWEGKASFTEHSPPSSLPCWENPELHGVSTCKGLTDSQWSLLVNWLRNPDLQGLKKAPDGSSLRSVSPPPPKSPQVQPQTWNWDNHSRDAVSNPDP